MVGSTIRIFVSSTFTDFVAERDALQRSVVPRLREHCARLGLRFQWVDLRWGVDTEAALDHSTIPICLEELRRSRALSPRPNLVILLGSRYGWQPLPETILADEFGLLLAPAGGEPQAAALLREWYALDENAVLPAYYLRLREPGGAYAALEVWRDVEAALHAALGALLSRTDAAPDLRRRYGMSATHLEIVEGALAVADAPNHVHCFVRRIDGLPEDPTAGPFIDLAADGRRDVAAASALHALETSLRTSLDANFHEYRTRWTGSGLALDYLDAFADVVFSAYEDVIRRTVAETAPFAAKPVDEPDGMRAERTAHLAFQSAATRTFLGRSARLAELLALGSGLDAGTLGRAVVLAASSGSGKSCLLGKAATELAAVYPQARLVARYIGASARSTDLRSLLVDLCLEIDRVCERRPWAC